MPGRTGQVGWELHSALGALGTVIAPDRRQMDLAIPDSIRRSIREANPDIIVNAAGCTLVDRVEAEPGLAMQVNGIASGVIAEEAKRLGALLIHYSSDYVYDGELDRPYVEDDAPNPVNAYGKTKLAGERAVTAVGGKYLILRTSWVYSARRTNFVLTILRLAREKPELRVVRDQTGSPSWARALAQATVELLRAWERTPGDSGIYHMAAAGHTSRCDFARSIIRIARELSGVHTGWAQVIPIASSEYPLPARRPAHPVTTKDRIKRAFGVEMPHWEEQLRSFLADHLKTGASASGFIRD
jgi:dTDP-4-dehydrorhamnose reductase